VHLPWGHLLGTRHDRNDDDTAAGTHWLRQEETFRVQEVALFKVSENLNITWHFCDVVKLAEALLLLGERILSETSLIGSEKVENTDEETLWE
jgi:hypothetical protein